MSKRSFELFRKLPKTVLGLMIFAFGVYLAIMANIGLAPWDALSMGISYHIPMSFGGASIGISLLVVAIDTIMREKIGLGTILNALLVGLFVDTYDGLGIVPKQSNMLLGIVVMIAGLFIMSLGQYFYMSTALGCGPRDTLLVGLGKRLPKTPIGVVNTLIMSAVLIGGWMLGAPIGVGTIVSTFGIGITMQITFRLLCFEPRDIVHQDLIETVRSVIGSKGTDASSSN